MSEPVEVRAPKGARLMEIVWDDGHTSFHRHHVLRGFCPCAICQGHDGVIEWVQPEGDDALELSELQPTGQYGIRLAWADGHRTGIYSFSYLRELASLYEASEEAIRARTFKRP